jgi:hypothetical protein
MSVIRTTGAVVREMMREAKREQGVKGAKTRTDRQQLRCLYALTDPRTPEARFCANDSVDFLERLYALDAAVGAP